VCSQARTLNTRELHPIAGMGHAIKTYLKTQNLMSKSGCPRSQSFLLIYINMDVWINLYVFRLVTRVLKLTII